MTKRFGLLKSVQASNNKGVTKDIRCEVFGNLLETSSQPGFPTSFQLVRLVACGLKSGPSLRSVKAVQVESERLWSKAEN